MSTTTLSPEQVNRYKRHLILPEVGMAGQKRLLDSKVLCIGVGGLGCPIALYLAAAGVGTIGLADVDVVSPSNLQRQILFGTDQVGDDKVAAAEARLTALNPDVTIVKHKTLVNSTNVMDLIAGYDVVIDGTDNFPTRYCVNDACVLAGKANVYGSIFRFEGMVTVFDPTRPHPERDGERGPCYRCLYPEPPEPGSVPSCAEGGVLGVLPGIIGTLQASETLKLLLGQGTPAIGKLLSFSALDFDFRTFKLRRDKNCPVCGDRPTITEPIDYEQFCGVPILDPQSVAETKNEVRRTLGDELEGETMDLDENGLPHGYALDDRREVTPRLVKQKLDAGETFMFIDCRLPTERDITHIAGSELLPLQTLDRDFDDKLDGKEDEEVVVYCRSGQRSLQFVDFLRRQGFTNARSMAGGILLWNKDVEPGGPQY